MVAAKFEILNEINIFLDEQTEQILQTLKRLDMLRAAVIRRDQGALEELIEQVHLQAEQKRETEIKQLELQRKLSVFCQCPFEEVNISRFCEQLTGNDRQTVQLKQSKLQRLITELNNECRAAELMLRECARFNRLLLSSLTGNNNQTRTYTAQGKEQRNVQWGLVNTKL